MKYSKSKAKHKMNALGLAQVPFLFAIDFEMNEIEIVEEDEFKNSNINFHIEGFREYPVQPTSVKKPVQSFIPFDYKAYEHGFNIVQNNIQHGNSYLLNLTYRSQIELNCKLEEIFNASSAKYRIFWKDRFVVFSPETFIKISEDKIYSYPMKGTIDVSEENALDKLLSDEKEIAEHYTIVDLIRNDLGRISSNVRVNKFRYVDKIRTNNKELYQTSSEISGELSKNWRADLGNMFFELLPAGSISGAPKQKTVEIIQEAESGPRGFYTGVFGYYDGKALDSGVMIRFIEKENDTFYYRSGGGITSKSDLESEYKELIQKIYVPII
jgi:para-aminobenzoate synthetase component 1